MFQAYVTARKAGKELKRVMEKWDTKSPEAEKETEKMFYCPKCKRWTVNKHDH